MIVFGSPSTPTFTLTDTSHKFIDTKTVLASDDWFGKTVMETAIFFDERDWANEWIPQKLQNWLETPKGRDACNGKIWGVTLPPLTTVTTATVPPVVKGAYSYSGQNVALGYTYTNGVVGLMVVFQIMYTYLSGVF